jgi:hypothetical protein
MGIDAAGFGQKGSSQKTKQRVEKVHERDCFKILREQDRKANSNK